MNWKDLFYFSKGERRAFSFLLLIGSATGFVLHLSPEPIEAEIRQESIHFISDSTPLTSMSTADSVHKSTNSNHPQTLRSRKATKPKPQQRNKLKAGQQIELNRADTTQLKQVPGIGSTFARRIVSYRELLGGYSSVEQLKEVYGIDEARYDALKHWFLTDTTRLIQIPLNQADFKTLLRHPYINLEQAKALTNYRNQTGNIHSSEQLMQVDVFTEKEYQRLLPYLVFD